MAENAYTQRKQQKTVANILSQIKTHPAAQDKKDFYGLGSATREEAEIAGKQFVGPGYHVTSVNNGYISADRLHVYRFPAGKTKGMAAGKTQANFESRLIPTGDMFSNGHLDITN